MRYKYYGIYFDICMHSLWRFCCKLCNRSLVVHEPTWASHVKRPSDVSQSYTSPAGTKWEYKSEVDVMVTCKVRKAVRSWQFKSLACATSIGFTQYEFWRNLKSRILHEACAVTIPHSCSNSQMSDSVKSLKSVNKINMKLRPFVSRYRRSNAQDF